MSGGLAKQDKSPRRKEFRHDSLTRMPSIEPALGYVLFQSEENKQLCISSHKEWKN